jgi:L-lactate dehydrogenase (cytochrome)
MPLADCHSIADLRRLAQARLPRAVFDYLDGAADEELTARWNQEAFRTCRLVPHVLRDVSQPDLSTSVLGERIALPLILAPTGMSRLFHHDGERAVARAAARAGTIYTLSSMATTSIEDVAALTKGPKWFQIYVWRDRAVLRDFFDRCRAGGYQALCLTVDLPVAGKRERDLRNGFTVPPKIRLGTVLDTLRRPYWLWNYLTSPPMRLGNVRAVAGRSDRAFSVIEYTTSQFDPSVSWDDAAWMIREWNGRFAIKGIASPEDARRAVDIGAHAVILSNHGGRQLDQGVAPFEMLAETVDAVAGRAEVILDGGVRRGTDVIKALCLGARACMIGRPYLYGLGAGGEAGVEHALAILRGEIERGMQLLGCARMAELGKEYLRGPENRQPAG